MIVVYIFARFLMAGGVLAVRRQKLADGNRNNSVKLGLGHHEKPQTCSRSPARSNCRMELADAKAVASLQTRFWEAGTSARLRCCRPAGG
jgi:hypothetical protein